MKGPIIFFEKGPTVNSASYYKHDSKKMFWEQWSVKKVRLTVFWDMKGTITIDFLKKGTTVNSASYYKHDSKKKFWE